VEKGLSLQHLYSSSGAASLVEETGSESSTSSQLIRSCFAGGESGTESSTSSGAAEAALRVRERGEAIGFAHHTERRQQAESAVCCGDINAVPEFSESLRCPIRQED
jgi:hypothetical protein